MRTISLTSAVLISINIIIGAGLFINPAPLAQIADTWSFAAYLLSAIVLLPLLLCTAELATLKPSAGGLYVYAHTYISPFAGFVSGWSYFLGKSTSAAILAFTFCNFLQSIVPGLNSIPTQALTIAVLFSLAFLNIGGVKIGGRVQWLFIALKAIPIGFVLLSCLFFVSPLSPDAGFQTLKQLPTALPIAIFALCGFEAICSIAHLIENPKKNVRRAILISFSIVAIASALFQFGMFQMLGPSLSETATPVLSYANQIFHDYPSAARLINAFVYLSVLGGSFGMLTSNCWNLHTIAKNQHLPGSSLLAVLSDKQVPWMSLLFEAGIASLVVTLQSNQVPLQNMAVFAMTASYLMSTIAAFNAARSASSPLPIWLPALSFLSCCYILWLCAKRILESGASSLFLILLAVGLLIAWMKEARKHRSSNSLHKRVKIHSSKHPTE